MYAPVSWSRDGAFLLLQHYVSVNESHLYTLELATGKMPANESEQIVATVRKQQVPVWYALATDEGHGFQKKPNRDYLLRATSQFFEQHLLR
jgi:hypothetical protein